MPKTKSIKDISSVHLLDWPVALDVWKHSALDESLGIIVGPLRTHVLKALEDKRQGGLIGSALEAKLIFESSSDRDLENLENYAPILKYIFIVSSVSVKKVTDVSKGLGEDFPKTQVVVEKADGEKCSRCWNYSTQVGQDKEHVTLCERCLPIVKS